jgi:hypothetical protein
MMRKTVTGCVDALLAAKEAVTLVDLPLISEFRLGIATPAPTTLTAVIPPFMRKKFLRGV